MKSKRIFLVNRDFQLRYTGAAVLVGALSTLFTSFILLYPLYQFQIIKIAIFVPYKILLIMGFAAFLNIAFLAMIGIMVTHRIAGPMYSLVKQFRRIEEGRWVGQMHLRPGDELRYLMRNFNAMLAALIASGEQDLSLVVTIKNEIKGSSLSMPEKEHLLSVIEGLYARIEKRLHPSDTEASVK